MLLRLCVRSWLENLTQKEKEALPGRSFLLFLKSKRMKSAFKKQEQRQLKLDALRYRKLRACSTVEFARGGKVHQQQNIIGSNFDPKRLDDAVDALPMPDDEQK